MSLGITRWPVWRRWFGSRSERAAARFLRRLGYRILARHVNLPLGALDLVGLAGRAVAAVKQRKLTNAALAFLQKHHLLDHPARFDVIAISWPANRREPHVV